MMDEVKSVSSKEDSRSDYSAVSVKKASPTKEKKKSRKAFEPNLDHFK